jgi:hypothetical protein
MLCWCSRNSAVTTAQIVWLPGSSGPVRQQPSRWNPVTGSVPQLSSSPPRTLRSGTAGVSPVGARRSDSGERPEGRELVAEGLLDDV